MIAALVGVITGVLLLLPLAQEALAQAQVARIGVLVSHSPATSAVAVDALRQRLSELGHVEGRNVVIEVRQGLAQPARIRGLARELVKARMDVIVTSSTLDTVGVREQTSTIPIVMVNVGDAVGRGLVKSLSRPGGNITGQSFLGPEMAAKGLGLLTEALPRARRVAVLFNPDISADPVSPLEPAARAKGITLEPVKIRSADDVPAILTATRRVRPDAVIATATSSIHLDAVAGFGVKQRIPTLFGFREAVVAGGLMSFGPSIPELWRGAASYADKILRGAKPVDLPVEQPTRFEMVINLKTAKAIGVTVPASVLARADEVIQ